MKFKVGKTSDFKLGDEVVISGQQSGVIKYLGDLHFQVFYSILAPACLLVI